MFSVRTSLYSKSKEEEEEEEGNTETGASTQKAHHTSQVAATTKIADDKAFAWIYGVLRLIELFMHSFIHFYRCIEYSVRCLLARLLARVVGLCVWNVCKFFASSSSSSTTFCFDRWRVIIIDVIVVVTILSTGNKEFLNELNHAKKKMHEFYNNRVTDTLSKRNWNSYRSIDSLYYELCNARNRRTNNNNCIQM